MLSWKFFGTVKALWHVFNWCKQSWCQEDTYISCWEDDHVPKQEKWLETLVSELNSGDYVYIGMLTKSSYPVEKYNEEYWRIGYKYIPSEFIHNYKNHPRWSEHVMPFEKWKYTDGGMYFSRFDLLQRINDKIGQFTNAPEDELYQRQSHGIEHGEVGFPSRVFDAGLRFKGLPSERRWKDSFIKYLDAET